MRIDCRWIGAKAPSTVSTSPRTSPVFETPNSEPGAPSHSYYRVEPLELDASVGGCELPIGFGVLLVARALPGSDFLDQSLLVRDAPVQALDRKRRGGDIWRMTSVA